MSSYNMMPPVIDPKLAAPRGVAYSAGALVDEEPLDDSVPVHYYPEGEQAAAASTTTALDESNKGFQLLQKMGWKGKGLGKNQDGIAEPIKAGVDAGVRLGLGKQQEDDKFTAAENIQRKKLEVELQIDEDPERTKRREAEATREAQIKQDVTEILKTFYCQVCNKQYTNAMELEEHLSSYDHHHKKRLAEARMTELERTRDERQRKEQRRQQREQQRLEEQIRKAQAAAARQPGKQQQLAPPPLPSEPPPPAVSSSGQWRDAPPPPPPLVEATTERSSGWGVSQAVAGSSSRGWSNAPAGPSEAATAASGGGWGAPQLASSSSSGGCSVPRGSAAAAAAAGSPPPPPPVDLPAERHTAAGVATGMSFGLKMGAGRGGGRLGGRAAGVNLVGVKRTAAAMAAPAATGGLGFKSGASSAGGGLGFKAGNVGAAFGDSSSDEEGA